MYKTESGEIVININELRDVFIGGRCKIQADKDSYNLSISNEEYNNKFNAKFYVNAKYLEDIGLGEFNDAYMSLNLIASGDYSSREGVENPTISYDNSYDKFGIVFVETDADGNDRLLDDFESYNYIIERFKPSNSASFDEEFNKLHDSSRVTDNLFWIALRDKFDENFNQWLYTSQGYSDEEVLGVEQEQTVIQVLLDRCERENIDLLPKSFTDFGMKFNVDGTDEFSVAEYVEKNNIKSLKERVESYKESLSAKKNLDATLKY